MSNLNALFLLADHIKLSLLERQRAKTLNLESDSQDGHISRSLEQLRDGLQTQEKERQRLVEAGDEAKAATLADSLPSLQKQYDDMASQFHGPGPASASAAATLTHPNDPSLASDFAHATSSKPGSPDAQAAAAASKKPGGGGKSVRFSDAPADLEAQADSQARGALFGRYRDDPDDSTAGYRERIEEGAMSNVQVHDYHRQVMAEQDAQLDALGASIGRQRELSMQIGDELDSQVLMLDDSERLVDRHQARLDRARGQLGRVARSAGENKQMVAIVVLIVILVLLIAVFK